MDLTWHEGSLGFTGPVCLGVDCGSISLKLAVTDTNGRLLASTYRRHHGRSIEVTLAALTEVFNTLAPDRFELVAGTGSAGRMICRLLDIPFVNEVICQARAIKRLHPEARTLIEMGGQDSKVVFLPPGDAKTRPMDDFAMNTNCAAGTGSFLDQQASRLGVDIEDEFGELALKSENPPRVAGRCSVFAKSDMIHLQQQATPVHDIVAGLCVGLARNLKSNFARGKEFDRPIAFCGGVASNQGVVHAIERVFELPNGGLIVPAAHAVSGAYGAVLVAQMDNQRVAFPTNGLNTLRDYLAKDQTIGHRLEPLTRPTDGYPNSEVCGPERIAALNNGDLIDAYLGIDVGSISTNVVVMAEDRQVLAKAYLMTAGRPLEAVRQGLDIVAEQVGKHVAIRGAATTGSGRYLTGDFVGADIVINEITAQATAAAIIDPTVDTIFEIGGQDSKYISLENGVVVDFEMNHACAAGTGSFIEEQAERLGIDIKGEFADKAMSSNAPIRLGERCTVFMESDLLSYQQQGAETEDLVAGLAYSIVTNYLNRVVGQRKIGQRIFFQGGTAFNKAVVAAFEKRAGKTITVPPHHEVTGALGAAVLAQKWMAQQGRTESTFRGFDQAGIEYHVRSFECAKCSNQCEIKEVTVPGRDPLFYGSRCDLYNVKKDKADLTGIPELFNERQRLLEQHCNLPKQPRPDAPTVGLPMALSNYQLGPFWATLLGELGLNVVLSGKSTKQVVRDGVERVLSTPCFPVKVAHGHVLKLIDKRVDYIWLPSIVSMAKDADDVKRAHLCPYVQTIPYQVQVALEQPLQQTKLLKLPVRFGHGRQALLKSLEPLCDEFNVSRRDIARAVEAATAAQERFDQAKLARGREILANLDDMPIKRAVVVISRPYNGCDPGVSLEVPDKLRKLGVLAIPMDFLDTQQAPVPQGDRVFSNMYWSYGQRILRATSIVRNHPKLNAIYLSNFSCGPDSFILDYFKRMMGAEPALILEIDEHSADAGVVTRLEAFLESLASADAIKARQVDALFPTETIDCSQRTVYIPWMGDAAHALAAAFRACGQPAEVLPIGDAETLEIGRKFTSGKECLPCIITMGDMIKKTRQPGFEPDKAAFFMPGGSGPCRFGQYHCSQKLALMDEGLAVPVVSPSQDDSFYNDFKQFRHDPTRLAWVGIAATDILAKAKLKTRPYETQTGQTDAVYQQALDDLCKLMETGPSEQQVAQLMATLATRFEAIPIENRDIPKIGLIGEIYVRCHDFANNNVVRQLESIGAEATVASFTEWIYYTNITRQWQARSDRNWMEWLQNILRDKVQHKIERRLAKPFESVFGPIAEPPIANVLQLAAKYMHHSFEGEAVLSIGKTVELNHEGCDAVINVMPFTCMPSTIVAGIMKKISADMDSMPTLSLSYDGQQDPTLQTRLEAFVHQAKAFRHSRNGQDEHAEHVETMPRPTSASSMAAG